MMTRVYAALMVAGALAACGSAAEDVAFDGHFYRTGIKDLDARHKFQVTAAPVSASLAGAREAARYEATIFCVNEYGSSAIEWVAGPDDADETLRISKDTLTLEGACPQ